MSPNDFMLPAVKRFQTGTKTMILKAKSNNPKSIAAKENKNSSLGKDSSIVYDITASNLTECSVNKRSDDWAQVNLKGKSLFFFTHRNYIRKYAGKIVINNIFEGFILLCIILSSILLAIENPLSDTETNIMKVVIFLDHLMTVVFTLEVFLKIIVYGLIINGRKSFLRNLWHLVDLILVILSISSIVFKDVELNVFRVLRLFRILRPMRMITKNEGLRVSVLALFSSIP